MSDFIINNKKLRSYSVQSSGTQELIKIEDKALMITDIIISKTADETVDLWIDDGLNKFPLLFVEDKGITQLSFPSGLKFWKNGSLFCNKSGDRLNLITIGYIKLDGDVKTWEVWNDGS